MLSELLLKAKIKKTNLQIVGLCILYLASKFEDNVRCSLEELEIHSKGWFSKEHLRIVEMFILEKLEWRICYPTAAEISRLMLYNARPDYDFSQVINQSDRYALECYK